jgi:hypothetical protein
MGEQNSEWKGGHFEFVYDVGERELDYAEQAEVGGFSWRR